MLVVRGLEKKNELLNNVCFPQITTKSDITRDYIAVVNKDIILKRSPIQSLCAMTINMYTDNN